MWFWREDLGIEMGKVWDFVCSWATGLLWLGLGSCHDFLFQSWLVPLNCIAPNGSCFVDGMHFMVGQGKPQVLLLDSNVANWSVLSRLIWSLVEDLRLTKSASPSPAPTLASDAVPQQLDMSGSWESRMSGWVSENRQKQNHLPGMSWTYCKGWKPSTGEHWLFASSLQNLSNLKLIGLHLSCSKARARWVTIHTM